MSISKISKKSFCDGASLPHHEDDNVVREAKIFLAKTNLLVDTGSAGIINHHALAIWFENFCVIIEGNSHEGKLVPRYEKLEEYEASLYALNKAHLPSNIFEVALPPLWLINNAKRPSYLGSSTSEFHLNSC